MEDDKITADELVLAVQAALKASIAAVPEGHEHGDGCWATSAACAGVFLAFVLSKTGASAALVYDDIREVLRVIDGGAPTADTEACRLRLGALLGTMPDGGAARTH